MNGITVMKLGILNSEKLTRSEDAVNVNYSEVSQERIDNPEIRIFGKNIFTFGEDIKNDLLFFPSVVGTHIPIQPWPIKFLVTKDLKDEGFLIVRKITFWYLTISAFQNLIVTTYHLVKLLLYRMGFLDVSEPYESLSFKHFTMFAGKIRRQRIKNHNSVQTAYASLIRNFEMGVYRQGAKPDENVNKHTAF